MPRVSLEKIREIISRLRDQSFQVKSPFVQGAIGGRILVRNEEGNGIVDENAPAPEEKVRPDLHISLR